MRGPTHAPPIPKFPVDGNTSTWAPGSHSPASCFSTRIEYAGPTLWDSVGNPRPDSTAIGAGTPVSASGSTTCGTAPAARHDRFQRLAGSSGRVRASTAACRNSAGNRPGSLISANVGPKISPSRPPMAAHYGPRRPPQLGAATRSLPLSSYAASATHALRNLPSPLTPRPLNAILLPNPSS